MNKLEYKEVERCICEIINNINWVYMYRGYYFMFFFFNLIRFEFTFFQLFIRTF